MNSNGGGALWTAARGKVRKNLIRLVNQKILYTFIHSEMLRKILLCSLFLLPFHICTASLRDLLGNVSYRAFLTKSCSQFASYTKSCTSPDNLKELCEIEGSYCRNVSSAPFEFSIIDQKLPCNYTEVLLCPAGSYCPDAYTKLVCPKFNYCRQGR